MKALMLYAGIVQGLYCLVLFLTALFLILLILIQRGRGGGLSGAFGGGMGGQSAFGAKAGDTFTKITIVAATFWICLCLVGVKWMGNSSSLLTNNSNNSVLGVGADPDLELDGDGGLDLEGNFGDDSGGTTDGEASAADGPSMSAPATEPAADETSPDATATETPGESAPADDGN